MGGRRYACSVGWEARSRARAPRDCGSQSNHQLSHAWQRVGRDAAAAAAANQNRTALRVRGPRRHPCPPPSINRLRLPDSYHVLWRGRRPRPRGGQCRPSQEEKRGGKKKKRKRVCEPKKNDHSQNAQFLGPLTPTPSPGTRGTYTLSPCCWTLLAPECRRDAHCVRPCARRRVCALFHKARPPTHHAGRPGCRRRPQPPARSDCCRACRSGSGRRRWRRPFTLPLPHAPRVGRPPVHGRGGVPRARGAG